MLDPFDRRHLMEILRPPDGYSLDYATGTTFSLDLLALMTAPLAFTIFEAECESRTPDPLALLESLRRYAGRICIYAMLVGFTFPKRTANPSTRSWKDRFSRRCHRVEKVHSTQRSGLCVTPHGISL